MSARVFYLVRIEDETGTSGTGIVAEGVLWTGGDVSIRWLGDMPCVHYWPGGIEHVKKIHGHRGKTKVVWADEPETPPASPAAPASVVPTPVTGTGPATSTNGLAGLEAD
jgi:hypothetical protein